MSERQDYAEDCTKFAENKDFCRFQVYFHKKVMSIVLESSILSFYYCCSVIEQRINASECTVQHLINISKQTKTLSCNNCTTDDGTRIQYNGLKYVRISQVVPIFERQWLLPLPAKSEIEFLNF